jgi:hypothetical protein
VEVEIELVSELDLWKRVFSLLPTQSIASILAGIPSIFPVMQNRVLNGRKVPWDNTIHSGIAQMIL